MRGRFPFVMCAVPLLLGLLVPVPAGGQSHQSIIPNLPATPTLSVPTPPSNGDENPYGVAFVPPSFPMGGPLRPGDILVSNFNDSANLQGTGTTIVSITPAGELSLFFQATSAPGTVGLTTALGVLARGFVLVGSLPTLDGSSATIQAPGSLLILDRKGNIVDTLSDSTLLAGPWDLTVSDMGGLAHVFVSNVQSGGVTRLDLNVPVAGANVTILSETQIASGYLTRTDPAALVVGPTGLAFDAAHNILYVASTGDNAIFAIANAATRTTDAGMGSLVFQDNVHLHGPLALALTPTGHLLAAQGDAVNPDATQPSEIVEFTPSGQFVAQFSIDSAPGSGFGLAMGLGPKGMRFAAVDDGLNVLDIWNLK